MSLKGDEDKDFKIVQKSNTQYEITELPNGKPTTVNVSDFDLEYGSLLRFK